MPQPSKLVTDRAKSSRAVRAAGTENLDAILKSAAERYGQPFADAAKVIIDTMVRVLEQNTAAMETADLAHAAELSDDDAARARREAAAEAGRKELMALRNALTAAYGEPFARSIGFDGRTPDDPQQVLHLLRTVGPALPSKSPPAVSTPGVQLDLEVFETQVTEAIPPLEKALDEVAREERQGQGTQVAKDVAVAQYDTAFQDAASLISGLLHVAGLSELARRVRPSAGRPGRTAGEVGDVTLEVPTPAPAEPS